MLSPQTGLVSRVALGQARLSRDREEPREAAAGPGAAPLSGEFASPSFFSTAGASREGVAPYCGDKLLSVVLSVIEESARECEDAVNLLLHFCESFSFVVETLVSSCLLGEAELSRTYKVRGVGCLKSLRCF